MSLSAPQVMKLQLETSIELLLHRKLSLSNVLTCAITSDEVICDRYAFHEVDEVLIGP